MTKFSNAVTAARRDRTRARLRSCATAEAARPKPRLIDAHRAVAEAAKRVHVETVIQGLCCSAAYWIAAASTSISASKGSSALSVGCYCVHEAVAGFSGSKSEKRCVQATVISAGPRNVDYCRWQPLTPE